jgi:hypothetical protein
MGRPNCCLACVPRPRPHRPPRPPRPHTRPAPALRQSLDSTPLPALPLPTATPTPTLPMQTRLLQTDHGCLCQERIGGRRVQLSAELNVPIRYARTTANICPRKQKRKREEENSGDSWLIGVRLPAFDARAATESTPYPHTPVRTTDTHTHTHTHTHTQTRARALHTVRQCCARNTYWSDGTSSLVGAPW